MRNPFFALLAILSSGCVGNVNVKLAPPPPTTNSFQESLAEVEVYDVRPPRAFDGKREAAFGVPMGDVSFTSDVAGIVKQTLEAELSPLLKSKGILAKPRYVGELREFGVRTDATVLYWDVIGSIQVVLKMEKKQFPLSGTFTERTYVWPGEDVIRRVMQNTLGQVSGQLRASLANEMAENLAGITTNSPQRDPSLASALSAQPSGGSPGQTASLTAQSRLGPLPANVSSQYLGTKTVDWMISFDEKTGKVGARSSLILGFKPTLPTGAYLEVQFENPTDLNAPIVVDLPRGTQQGVNPFDAYFGVTVGNYKESMKDPHSSVIEGSAPFGEKVISILSPLIQGLKCKNYQIVVNVYKDASKSQLLGTHEQFSQFGFDSDLITSEGQMMDASAHPGKYCP